jgi:AcrR family transcriptional regulator
MMQSQQLDPSLNRLDPRIARSESAIRNALLEQLRSGRGFNSLTVSEIAEQAGVTRKTFYARFGSLEQLVERMVLDLFTEFESRMDDQMLIMPVVNNTLTMMVLNQCEEHRAVLTPLVSHCSASLFMEPLSKVLTRLLERVTGVNDTPKLDEVDQAYLVAMIASVIHGVLSVWVKRGFCDAPERIAKFADTLLVEGMQKVILAGGIWSDSSA